MNDTQVRLTDKRIIFRLFSYLKGHVFGFCVSVLLMLLSVSINLIMPVLLGEAARLLGLDQINMMRIVWIVVIYAISLLVSLVIMYNQALILQKIGQKIIYNIREEVFSHIQKFSAAQLNQTPVGKLVTRVTNDTNTLSEIYTNVIINLMKNIFTIIGVFAAMLILNWKLSLVVLLFSPVLFGLSVIFRKFSRKAYRQVRNNLSDVNAFLSENISGMKITQVFSQEEKKLKEFQVRNNALKKSSLTEIFIFGIFRPAIYVIYVVTLALVLWFGGNWAIGPGTVSYDTILVFTQYVDMLYQPLQQLAEQFNVLQSAFAAAEKVFAILDTEPEIIDADDAIELDSIKGDIEFKHVWFSYLPGEWILKDVSFKIKPQETVAFVGATGSGKTTILSLIVRNYDIQKGEILLDGIDIRKIKISSLRRHIGQMPQDVFLFSGTVLSNIQMREPTISMDDVKQAAEYVNADKFIEKLPNKYDEEVRERGNNFSSGQRQLLSFARTVVHKPAIMILDEATANIDTETEMLIQDSLEKMMNIGTMLIVAHRLSTIQHADNIIVLQKGEIIETGTHQELLKQRGQYYKLYQLQDQGSDIVS
ncbi:MAG: ABC transporter ATP-binding protein [Acholeplasmataceae bacterium]|nr:ABC transporter ATP-binding protein [Acholeplasmataceae bacterium]